MKKSNRFLYILPILIFVIVLLIANIFVRNDKSGKDAQIVHLLTSEEEDALAEDITEYLTQLSLFKDDYSSVKVSSGYVRSDNSAVGGKTAIHIFLSGSAANSAEKAKKLSDDFGSTVTLYLRKRGIGQNDTYVHIAGKYTLLNGEIVESYETSDNSSKPSTESNTALGQVFETKFAKDVIKGLTNSGYEYKTILFNHDAITLSRPKDDDEFNAEFYLEFYGSGALLSDIDGLCLRDESFSLGSEYKDACNKILSILDIDDTIENVMMSFDETYERSDIFYNERYAWVLVHDTTKESVGEFSFTFDQYEFKVFDVESADRIAKSKNKREYTAFNPQMLEKPTVYKGTEVVLSGTIVEKTTYGRSSTAYSILQEINCQMQDGTVVFIKNDAAYYPVPFKSGETYTFYGYVSADGCVRLDFAIKQNTIKPEDSENESSPTEEPSISGETSVAEESSIPNEPSEAEESSLPDVSDVADESTAPSEPSVSEELSAPDESSAPNEPSIPSEPAVPEEPSIPDEPDASVEPSAPEEIIEPSEPDISDEPAVSHEPAKPTYNVPTEYISALKKAQTYCSLMHMSKARLHLQLVSEYGEEFTEEAANWAIEHLNANWKENALNKGQFYSDEMHFSKARVFTQLVSEYGEQFTTEEAQYAIDHIKADWKENALATGQNYADSQYLSKAGIYDQLTHEVEGFTESEAQYAIDHIKADWNKIALHKGQFYSDEMHMSKAGIYDQLASEVEGFTATEAQYAVDHVKADWKENALATAIQYQETMALSPARIYEMLTSEYFGQFTEEEAQYAIDNLP